MSGSTLIVLSLQCIGTVRATSTVRYKKSSESESEWTTWTGDSQDITPTHPYRTYWYWDNQHWRLVMDNLEPATEYNIEVTVNGSEVPLPTLTISTCALPPLWDFQISSSVRVEANRAYVQQSIDNCASWRATAQAVGCAPLRTLYLDYSSQTGVRASCGFNSALSVSSTPVAISHYDYQVVYHELRHYFGADGMGSSISRTSDGMMEGSDAQVMNKGDIFTEANDSVLWGCRAAYTNAAKDYIYYKKAGTVYSNLDEVMQFKTGSDLARYHIVNGHDCVNDFTLNSKVDIMNWFVLRAMMFNKISIKTVTQ